MNLDDSTDELTNDYSTYWESIPDPPKLTVAAKNDGNPAAAPRRRRRDSALKDVTNALDNEDILKTKNRSDEFSASFSVAIDEEITSQKRSNKKRRSLLLPSDDGVNILADSLHSHDDAASSVDVAILPCTNNAQVYSSSIKQDITRLVRNYCSLPPNQRLNSYESKQIQSLSNYPMPGTTLNVFNNDNETNRREFLLRAQPLVRKMEDQKQKDIDDARTFTGCEVKRIKRGFQYLDLQTLKAVSAEEYGVRYCTMIEKRRRERRGEDYVTEKASPLADDSNMDMDESVFSPDDSLVHVDNDDTPVTSSVEIAGKTLAVSSDAQQPEATRETTEQNEPNTSQSTASSYSSLQDRTNTTQKHPLIGAMPPSNDPRVLEARKKLFRAFDTALAAYSQEIMTLTQLGSK